MRHPYVGSVDSSDLDKQLRSSNVCFAIFVNKIDKLPNE